MAIPVAMVILMDMACLEETMLEEATRKRTTIAGSQPISALIVFRTDKQRKHETKFAKGQLQLPPLEIEISSDYPVMLSLPPPHKRLGSSILRPHHMCNNCWSFKSCKNLRQPMVIELGDDNTVWITHHWLVDATQGFEIDALDTPTSGLALFSVNQMDSTGSTAMFGGGKCSISSPKSQTTITASAKWNLVAGSLQECVRGGGGNHNRRESDPRRAFQPAFGITGISDDWYGRTMGAIVKSLRAPGTVAQQMREFESNTERCLGSYGYSLEGLQALSEILLMYPKQ